MKKTLNSVNTVKKTELRLAFNLKIPIFFKFSSNFMSYSTNNSSNFIDENLQMSRMNTESSEKKYKRFLQIYQSDKKIDENLQFQLLPYLTTLQTLKR